MCVPALHLHGRPASRLCRVVQPLGGRLCIRLPCAQVSPAWRALRGVCTGQLTLHAALQHCREGAVPPPAGLVCTASLPTGPGRPERNTEQVWRLGACLYMQYCCFCSLIMSHTCMHVHVYKGAREYAQFRRYSASLRVNLA